MIAVNLLPSFHYEIQPKPKNHRQTPVKQIAQFAKDGKWSKAWELAVGGKIASPVERVVFAYLGAKHMLEESVRDPDFKRIFSGNDDIGVELDLAELLKFREKALCTLFVEAVRNYDGQRIIEIANAVWSFEENAKCRRADRERMGLLILMAKLKLEGKQWTARQIAEYVTKTNSPTKEQIDSIRDKAIQIGLIPKTARKIRKK